MGRNAMKIATDYGFPKASFGGSDPGAFDAFKNERDYIAQGGKMQGTVAAMDWGAAEIERLRAALRPFAELGGKLETASNLVGLLTEEDFQRARNAYNGGGQ